MALYLARRLELGKIDYLLVFSNPNNASLKADVDEMLIADGRQELIVEVPAIPVV